MMLRYSPEARKDIKDLYDYISTDLINPTAAAKITEEILRKCSNLAEFPMLGTDLSEKTGRETDLRYLVLGRHIAIYRIEEWITCVLFLKVKNSLLPVNHCITLQEVFFILN